MPRNSRQLPPPQKEPPKKEKRKRKEEKETQSEPPPSPHPKCREHPLIRDKIPRLYAGSPQRIRCRGFTAAEMLCNPRGSPELHNKRLERLFIPQHRVAGVSVGGGGAGGGCGGTHGHLSFLGAGAAESAEPASPIGSFAPHVMQYRESAGVGIPQSGQMPL